VASPYAIKPKRFFTEVHQDGTVVPPVRIYCAGFELSTWRCDGFAKHLFEWLPEYALPEDELSVNHANAFVKLQQAAVRVYTTKKPGKRGEIGELALHAICRDFFKTVPISARVFYKSSSNDVVKAFDLVHARFPDNGDVEIWLGESKFYASATSAIAAAIGSIREHIDQGFLTDQKLLLGPQIPKSTPNYDDVVALFESQTSLDELISAAVFPVAILASSPATSSATQISASHKAALKAELEKLALQVEASGLCTSLRVLLIYVPVGDKAALTAAFDKRLKALQ
jgi:hypothetical protein